MQMFISKLRKKFSLFLVGILCLLLGVVIGYFIFTQACPNTSVLGEKIDEPVIEGEECSIFVDVSGAVNNPNVYCLEEKSLVIDAVKIAGGYKAKEYAKKYVEMNINLSKELTRGDKIYIPYASDIEDNLIEQPIECININTSSLEDLEKISGVGEITAKKIVENRPYKNLEDLINGEVVSKTVFEKIGKEICI